MADLIKQDAGLTVKDIANSVGISSGSVHKILTQQSKLRKVCDSMCPHLLIKEQKATHVICSLFKIQSTEIVT